MHIVAGISPRYFFIVVLSPRALCVNLKIYLSDLFRYHNHLSTASGQRLIFFQFGRFSLPVIKLHTLRDSSLPLDLRFACLAKIVTPQLHCTLVLVFA